MFGGMGEAFSGMFKAMVVALCITVPLGIWKLVDIGIYIYQHLNVSWK